ncbi:MAG TPA: hypothetical protein VFC37_10575 [Terracidiphilus sp.]|jgi:hypothetical protein|nr:hypothetical protein [Terracidiphilus sp.]
MNAFGSAAVFGACLGFLWGIGCSLAVMYSIYLAGYRKAIKESLAKEQPVRYQEALRKIEGKKARKQAARLAKAEATTAEPQSRPL